MISHLAQTAGAALLQYGALGLCAVMVWHNWQDRRAMAAQLDRRAEQYERMISQQSGLVEQNTKTIEDNTKVIREVLKAIGGKQARAGAK